MAQKNPTGSKNGNQVEIHTSAVCGMCKETLEYNLTFEKGVKTVLLDLNTKNLTVNYNPKKTTPDKLRQSISHLGYHADSVQRDSLAYHNLPLCCKEDFVGLHSPEEKR